MPGARPCVPARRRCPQADRPGAGMSVPHAADTPPRHAPPSRARGSARALAALLLTLASPDGVVSGVSRADLALALGVSERTVTRAVGRLADLGELLVLHGGGGARSTYALTRCPQRYPQPGDAVDEARGARTRPVTEWRGAPSRRPHAVPSPAPAPTCDDGGSPQFPQPLRLSPLEISAQGDRPTRARPPAREAPSPVPADRVHRHAATIRRELLRRRVRDAVPCAEHADREDR